MSNKTTMLFSHIPHAKPLHTQLSVLAKPVLNPLVANADCLAATACANMLLAANAKHVPVSLIVFHKKNSFDIIAALYQRRSIIS